jgi:flagellar hook-length control protein FliK
VAEQAQALADTASSMRTETANAAAKTGAEALAGVTDLTATNTHHSEAPTPTAVDMPTPTADPDFPDVFATQVSVLVKDGVQQAELHLNPAEMGPIAVQIAVDGSQAQVDFAAATGATRELIETSLPMLAAALHEAGLTLAGGGVFEHGRHASHTGHGGAGSSSSQRGGEGQGTTVVEGATTPQAATRRVAVRGAVDLYA